STTSRREIHERIECPWRSNQEEKGGRTHSCGEQPPDVPAGERCQGENEEPLQPAPGNTMQPIFSSTEPFEAERVHAVAIYCSDGRYGDHFDQFLHRHLCLPNYDRLAIAGGPAWLSYRSSASLIQYGMVREQLDFLVGAHGLRRAVLIAHYGCAYYLH